MDTSASWLFYLLLFFISHIIYSFVTETAKAPGILLKSKFQSLGILQGKTLSDITSVVGTPDFVTTGSDGKTIYQWIRTDYHIILIFDGEICEGISQELSLIN